MSGERHTVPLDWDRFVVAADASKQGTRIRIVVTEGVRECSIVSPTLLIITQENGNYCERKGVSGLSSDPC